MDNGDLSSTATFEPGHRLSRGESGDERWALPATLALAAVVVLILQHAWVTEDAYITLRTVDNWVNGYGLRWNVDERVQTFTHPLWMLLLTAAYAVTREALVTTVAVSVVVSGAALYILAFKVSRTWAAALTAILVLGLSRPFVDYSTSGLENPLTHLLIAALAWLYFRADGTPRSLGALAIIAGLMTLNRLDTTLLWLPALGYTTVRFHSTGQRVTTLVAPLAIGFAPVGAWLAFSLFYFGFPLPNTAYAKLGTGIPGGELFAQGTLYFLDLLQRDPVTSVFLIAGWLVVWLDGNRKNVFLALGAPLYLCYAIAIGGDFMSGRFFTAPFFLTVCCVVNARTAYSFRWLPATVLLPVLLLGLPRPSAGYEGEGTGQSGVADERAFWSGTLSLAAIRRVDDPYQTDLGLIRQGEALRAAAELRAETTFAVSGNVGILAFTAGPGVHIVDRVGLTDPLLARLPALRRPGWRIGHAERALPDQYLESLRSGGCRFGDDDLCRYWMTLRLITRGRLWSLDRFRAIVAMNLGHYDTLVDVDRYRYAGMISVAESRLPAKRIGEENNPGSSSAAVKQQGVQYGPAGVQVALDRPRKDGVLIVSVSGHTGFDIEFLQAGLLLGEVRLRPLFEIDRVVERSVNVPARAQQTGFDRIRLLPYTKSPDGRLEHLEFGADH